MEQNPSTTTAEIGRWSFLPDVILEDIVSHLDIPGGYTITISANTFKISISNNIPRLWSVLDNLFTMFCSPFITNFVLLLPYTAYKQPCSSIIFDSWACHLRARNLQHLFIGSYDAGLGRHISCPPTIFRIHSLVSLNIDRGISNRVTMPFCNSITLPKLKVLRLDCVDCYRSLELILRVCPSLETLSLIIEDERPQKDKKSPVVIAGKNIKQLFLHLKSDTIIEATIDAPKLEDFEYISNNFISMRMFDSISHVKSLDIIMGSEVRLYNSPTKTNFPNLSRLKLRVSNEYDKINAIFSMLRYSPNLEVLHLEYTHLEHMTRIPTANFMPIVEHLKQITVYVCHDRLNEHMSNGAMYLLRSAPVLEKLVIYGIFEGSVTKSGKAQFHLTLLECPKASPSCEIEFLIY